MCAIKTIDPCLIKVYKQIIEDGSQKSKNAYLLVEG